MFVVKRCVVDYNEVWRTEVTQFSNELEAVAFAEAEDRFQTFSDVWHEVEEE